MRKPASATLCWCTSLQPSQQQCRRIHWASCVIPSWRESRLRVPLLCINCGERTFRPGEWRQGISSSSMQLCHTSESPIPISTTDTSSSFTSLRVASLCTTRKSSATRMECPRPLDRSVPTNPSSTSSIATRPATQTNASAALLLMLPSAPCSPSSPLPPQHLLLPSKSFIFTAKHCLGLILSYLYSAYTITPSSTLVHCSS